MDPGDSLLTISTQTRSQGITTAAPCPQQFQPQYPDGKAYVLAQSSVRFVTSRETVDGLRPVRPPESTG